MMANGKQKINPVETYVLGDDELDELDDASLTSIMREMAHPSLQGESQEEIIAEQEDNEPIRKDYRDQGIEELLRADTDVTSQGDQESETTGTFGNGGPLLPPEALFPDEYGDES